VPASKQQSGAFLKLRNDLHTDGNWIEFWKLWDGFIWTIIRKKLFSDPGTWEDCKSLVDIKIFRFIKGFEETREISPWLACVVTSCCEDIKKLNEQGRLRGVGDLGEEFPWKTQPERTMISLDDENAKDLLNIIKQPDPGNNPERGEMLKNLWICIEAAMKEIDVDPRQKVAFELFYRQERKLREIAEIYHLPESTVNNWPGATLKRIQPIVKAGMEKLGYKSSFDDKKR